MSLATSGPRLRIYLAGKISKNGWREEILGDAQPGVELYPWDLQQDTEWPVIPNAVLGYHEYVGPFFIGDDHGCYHDPHRHGMAAYTDLVPKKYIHTLGEKGGLHGKTVTQLCLQAVSKANFVFAWLDAPTAYGTFCELGYAIAKNKAIYLSSPSGFSYRKDLWFFETLSHGWIVGDTPLKCLEMAIDHFFRLKPSKLQAYLKSTDSKFAKDPIAQKWRYTPERTRGAKWSGEAASDSQIRYINQLAAKEPETAEEMLHLVRLELGKEARFGDCNKGLAGFVIAALLGNIKPIA